MAGGSVGCTLALEHSECKEEVGERGGERKKEK